VEQTKSHNLLAFVGVIALAGCAAMIAIYLIVQFQARANRAHEAETILARVDIMFDRQHSRLERALFERDEDDLPVYRERRAQEEALLGSLLDKHSDHDLLQLSSAYSSYWQAVDESIRSLELGRTEAAMASFDEVIEPLAEEVQTAMDTSEAHLITRAHSAERAATRGTIGVTLAAAATVAVLWFLYWRATTRARIADVQKHAIEENEARFRSLIQNSASVITVPNLEGLIQYQSQQVDQVLCHSPTDLLHSRFVDIVHPDDAGAFEALLGKLQRLPNSKGALECRLHSGDGRWVQCEIIAQNLQRDAHVRGIVLSSRDITERKALEAQLERKALQDPLTGLPNRALFRDRVVHTLAQPLRAERCNALLFLDLDDFKNVNDSLGHAAGDQVLLEVGERLEGCVRLRDTVARFGGDEFALLLERISEEEALVTAQRILDTMRRPFQIGERLITSSVSIGIVFSRSVEDEPDSLIRDADTAMYTAKARGKGRYEVFNPAMHAAVLERLDIEAEMRAGIDKGEFVIFYQPLVDFSTRKIVGVEALLRWLHPSRGILLPKSFMSVAEETGLIIPLGEWVLTTASKEARAWQLQHLMDPPLFLSVNVSGKQLQQDNLIEVTAKALTDSSLPPESLILEITESILAESTEAMIRRLKALRALRVKLAIDDFGTG
jgi:diguanylate cyclase (GGDEF)-like protein/PAS domain S-box-containing protein